MATQANRGPHVGGSAQARGRPVVGPAQAGGPDHHAGGPAEAGGPDHHIGGPGDPAHSGSPGHPAVGPAQAGGHQRSGPGAPGHHLGSSRYYVGGPGHYVGGARHRAWHHGHWLGYGRRWPWLYRDIWGDGLIPSPTVTWAQACLAKLLGPGVPQDGILGPATRQAIEQFQMQQQLPPTGMLDDNTVNALQAVCSGQQEALLAGEIGESEGEYAEFGELGASRMVDPAKVDCAKLNRSLPIFRAIGTTDPVGVLEVVCRRAVAMLDNTIAELTRIRARVHAGEPPAFPLIGDLLGWSLQTRMLMRAGDPMAWTGTGPRTADQILRWLTNIRKTIASGDLWYTCLASLCDPHPRRWAFVFLGHFRIHLCRRFWRPETDAATHLEFQAQTIIHEVSHIYYDTEDSGRGPGDAECIAQFIADANGSPIDQEFVGVCGPRGPRLEQEFSGDASDTAKAYQHSFEEPYQQPQWPSSRSFNPPPAQTIPAGPYKTFSPCESIIDDLTRLSLAVDDLKNQLRQRPSNPGRVGNRSDIVTALSRQIVARLQNLSYVQQGCTKQDMQLFASSVSVMRGPGADSDPGSWPPASSPREQGQRKTARESLRHLLAWIRRADRNFPRI